MKLRAKFGLFVSVAVGATLLGLNVNSVTPRLATGETVAYADTTVNAVHQGMTGDSKTSNNDALQNLIDKWDNGAVTVHVPKGTYVFDAGNIVLHSNMTFKFDKGAVFRITDGNRVNFVYPSPEAGYDGGISNVTWKGATFQGDNMEAGQSVFTQSIHHAKNISFDQCVFDNAESPTGHYIDIDGSHDVNITNSVFTGFNGSQDFKEAIQVDYSNKKAMSHKNPGDKYDNLPSYDVTVDNNQFLPVSKKSGQVDSYAPNPIGEHAVYGHGAAGIIHNVYFTNNTVVDPKPLLDDGVATIHFKCVSNLWITGNKFINQHVLGSGNYIYLYNSEPGYQMSNLNITDNTFTNVNPTKQYVYLDTKDTTNPMTDVTIQNNDVTTQHKGSTFVDSNFPLTGSGMTIDKNKITVGKVVSTDVTSQQTITDTTVDNTASSNSKPKPKPTTSQKLKKRKQTNKNEQYVAGLATQHAELASNYKTYSLYNHVRGHKNWNIMKFDWKSLKKKRVYIDMRATADTGKWYRIRLSKNATTKYWIRAGALDFDQFDNEVYDRDLNLMKIYPVYTRPFNDPLLAKQKGTTADIAERRMTITHRVKRTDSKGNVTTYYQMANGLWTRALAFDLDS
ncbi:N-acetylmuramoyl-L-alanine amidase [Levilactobacillus koreensis]|uniref:N-acetylmuramoyl-L-alanine amidase n=1 Tax=Levilactobacillus koreensis TaxID=637971 RepID=A0AAC8UVZ0_9LACO|nr:N-acetylmuramoyl-L-alanine amidase [Levilactobacillus koreensis]AKP64937.1 N-acetylmuramoyl-L-alanine amidase [Levilactobacillus koreensis]